MQIEVRLLLECGHDQAVYGIGKNKGITSGLTFDEFMGRHDLRRRLEAVALKLASAGQGHSKFLRQIALWFEIRAPRYIWAELDTYKIGTVAQSESTVYTIRKGVTHVDFENGDITWGQIQLLMDRIAAESPLESIKRALPESFLQTRIWSANYDVMRNIFTQRRNHPLPHWRAFIQAVTDQVEHPEYLKIGSER